MKEWVRMPSAWLTDSESPLRKMRWSGSGKADQIAALMLYIVLVHHACDIPTSVFPKSGVCKLSYTQLSDITSLSRAKIAGGLKLLCKIRVIEIISNGHSNSFYINNYENKSGWAKLPAKGLYARQYTHINAFSDFHLRKKNELNALKVYLVILALRNIKTNYAKVGYDKLSQYTGVHRNELKSAISLLINLELVRVDSGSSEKNEFATVNLYRPCFLESYKHQGTVGSKWDESFT